MHGASVRVWESKADKLITITSPVAIYFSVLLGIRVMYEYSLR